MSGLALDLKDAKKCLPNGQEILNGVNLQIPANTSCALVGKSGSGKTTLLSILGLIDRLDSGTYSFNGVSVTDAPAKVLEDIRANQIGYIYQNFSLISHLSVMDNVVSSLIHSRSRSSYRQQCLKAHDYLDRVSMASHARKRPGQLSGGEKQRVAIARALVREPTLILADEPTGSLDEQTGAGVLDLLTDCVRTDGSTLLVVTHDRNLADRLDCAYQLDHGQLVKNDVGVPHKGRHTQTSRVQETYHAVGSN